MYIHASLKIVWQVYKFWKVYIFSEKVQKGSYQPTRRFHTKFIPWKNARFNSTTLFLLCFSEDWLDTPNWLVDSQNLSSS